MPFSSSLRFVVLVRDPIARMYSKFLHKDIAELCYCTSRIIIYNLCNVVLYNHTLTAHDAYR